MIAINPHSLTAHALISNRGFLLFNAAIIFEIELGGVLIKNQDFCIIQLALTSPFSIFQISCLHLLKRCKKSKIK